MLYIGIDPGVNGGIAWMKQKGEELTTEAVKMPESLKDLKTLLWNLAANNSVKSCALEKVASRPGQGVKSTFTFGRVYGQVEAAVVCCGIPLERVSASKWQKSFSLITPSHVSRTVKKNKHKAAAQELWPDLKITHATADALLICEWWRRWHKQPALAEPDKNYHTGPSMTKEQIRKRHKRIMKGE